MTVTCVVQARAGSTRFPGKVLAALSGRPLLAFLLGRLEPLADHAALVVATSEAPADDAVAEVAQSAGAAVVRGPEKDVLARFARALDVHPADHVVRLTGDCPLADPNLVSQAIAIAQETGADYVSNTLVRTHPDGLDVEVARADALRAAHAEASNPVEREHVTPFIYRRPERFTLRAMRAPGFYADRRWTVDTPEDLTRIRTIVSTLGRTTFPWEDALPADAAAPVPGDRMRLVPAMAEDSDFLFRVRNDPESIRWSQSGRSVAAAEHATWFASVLVVPARRAWVAWRGDDRVGTVRIDVTGGVGTVSIALAPEWRAKGLGRDLLGGLVRELAADEQVHTLEASIHADNTRSRRLFAGTGFVEVGREGDYVVSRRPRRESS